MRRIAYFILVWASWAFAWIALGVIERNMDNILFGAAFLIGMFIYLLLKIKREKDAPCYSDFLESIPDEWKE